MPRYDPAKASYSAKGEATVALLQLDRREALANGHRRAWRRLVEAIKLEIDTVGHDTARCSTVIEEFDDYDLAGCCCQGGSVSLADLLFHTLTTTERKALCGQLHAEPIHAAG